MPAGLPARASLAHRSSWHREPEPGGEGIADLLAQATLAGPGFTIRGGSSDVLLGIVARAEASR